MSDDGGIGWYRQWDLPPSLYTKSASANSDIVIIQTGAGSKADKDALSKARARLVTMTDHDIDVLEGSLAAEKDSRDPEFANLPVASVRVYIRSERRDRASKAENNQARTDRHILIAKDVVIPFITPIIAALAGFFAGWLAKGL
jgi:hypothetical protein